MTLRGALVKYAEATNGYPTSNPTNHRGPVPGAPPPPPGLGSSPIMVTPGAVGSIQQKNAGWFDDFRKLRREVGDNQVLLDDSKLTGNAMPFLTEEQKLLRSKLNKHYAIMGAIAAPVAAGLGYGSYRLGKHLFSSPPEPQAEPSLDSESYTY